MKSKNVKVDSSPAQHCSVAQCPLKALREKFELTQGEMKGRERKKKKMKGERKEERKEEREK